MYNSEYTRLLIERHFLEMVDTFGPERILLAPTVPGVPEKKACPGCKKLHLEQAKKMQY